MGYRNGLELTHFDCSLISHHSIEYEQLFIGGYRPLKICGIRIIANHQNYYWFTTAINLFDCFLNGKKMSSKQVKCIKSRHYVIIHQLIKHQMSKNHNNKYPIYINQIFHRFCNKKKQIHI